ncbi:MAG: type II toxin-antitoxin system HicB family antitoxin [Chloroflexi bacterium]|nr:type II toxin-antitoxin system HicB family antitoxin [Chloroflexota bacterium]
MREPSEETEDKYMAEIPSLPGCRAWGENAAEAIENIQSLAAAFIESYRARGDSLPSQVEAAGSEVVEPLVLGEVLVAA